MRDVLLTLLVFGSLPFILKRPHIGVLVWAWLSYMNPHRLTWSFAYDMPFAQIVAITLLIALFSTKEKLKTLLSKKMKKIFKSRGMICKDDNSKSIEFDDFPKYYGNPKFDIVRS